MQFLYPSASESRLWKTCHKISTPASQLFHQALIGRVADTGRRKHRVQLSIGNGGTEVLLSEETQPGDDQYKCISRGVRCHCTTSQISEHEPSAGPTITLSEKYSGLAPQALSIRPSATTFTSAVPHYQYCTGIRVL